MRLQMSLESARNAGFTQIVAALHPPYDRRGRAADLPICWSSAVKICVFGHIHDAGREHIFQAGATVTYRFAAADLC